jgi:hypothetical protein
MLFVCPAHGKFEPTQGIMYSCPAQAACPECGCIVCDISPDGGINIITDEEQSVLLRPGMYKELRPDLYEKYKDKIEGNQE